MSTFNTALMIKLALSMIYECQDYIELGGGLMLVNKYEGGVWVVKHMDSVSMHDMVDVEEIITKDGIPVVPYSNFPKAELEAFVDDLEQKQHKFANVGCELLARFYAGELVSATLALAKM